MCDVCLEGGGGVLRETICPTGTSERDWGV